MYLEHDSNDATKRIFDNIINPVSVKQRVKARFKLRAMKGNIIMRESAWCPNLIVNGWFNNLFGVPSLYGICGFLAGAGTAAAAETDTALVSYLGGGNDYQQSWVTTNSTVSPRTMTLGVRYRGAEGAVVGNVSEIAMYWSTSGIGPAPTRSIINRARVVDELGNPTSVTVLSDEFLEVIWEFTYFAIEGATGVLTINIAGTPTNFNYEIRPVSMKSNNVWIASPSTFSGGGVRMETSGIPTVGASNMRCNLANVNTFGDPDSAGYPTGGTTFANNFTTRVLGPYTTNSKTRLTTVRLPLNNGNHASPGARTIYLALAGPSDSNPWCTHQMLLDGPVLKSALQLFDLPINVSMGNA